MSAPLCLCRSCGKKYNEHKATADYKGYCTQRCFHARAKLRGYSVAKESKYGRLHSEYAILNRVKDIGSVYALPDPLFTDPSNPVRTLIEAAAHAMDARQQELGQSCSRAAAYLATDRDPKYLQRHEWDLRTLDSGRSLLPVLRQGGAPMTPRFVQPGDVVRIEVAHSEVCMHMHVAGEVMNVRFQSPYGYPNAQLLLDDGREFSAPITPGEAGFYCGEDGRYYCYEVAEADPGEADDDHPDFEVAE